MEAENEQMRAEIEEMRRRKKGEERKSRDKHSANISDGGKREQSSSGKNTEKKPTINQFNRVGFLFNVRSLADQIIELRNRNKESA